MRPNQREELREDGRTNLYLAAILRWTTGATDVRIRNLSARGALIDAGVLPLAGTAVELVRGDLRVSGSVAWSSGNRAGLRLEELVAAREWMASAGSTAQQRVDGLVRAVRSGDAPADRSRSTAEGTASLASDLRLACTLVDQLGDVLASDRDMISRHGPALQSLDVVQQLLEALARSDAEPGRHGARLTDLRASVRAALAAVRPSRAG